MENYECFTSLCRSSYPNKISQIINFHQTILDVEKRSKNIGRPLCTAAQYESLRCMCLLLKSGFNVEVSEAE